MEYRDKIDSLVSGIIAWLFMCLCIFIFIAMKSTDSSDAGVVLTIISVFLGGIMGVTIVSGRFALNEYEKEFYNDDEF